MFIQTEETPNPDVLKFLPGEVLVEGKGLEFKTKEDAFASPFAQKIFDVMGVRSIYIGIDFVSITKDSKKDWFVLKPLLLSTMIDALTMGLPIYEASLDRSIKEKIEKKEILRTKAEEEIIDQIKDLLETRVKPAVAQDGGDIQFFDYESGIVYLEMRGACAGCPSSTATLKAGIENMLRYYIPEIQEIRAVHS